MPVESFFWPGGKLPQDHGIVIYDVNHLKASEILSYESSSPLIRCCFKLNLQKHWLWGTVGGGTSRIGLIPGLTQADEICHQGEVWLIGKIRVWKRFHHIPQK